MRARNTVGEILTLCVMVVLFLLALFMLVMACVVTANPNFAAMEHVTAGKAWQASMVAAFIFCGFTGWANRRLDKKLRRLKQQERQQKEGK